MRELKLSAHHRADIELCYKKERGECRLYDDTIPPRVLIATISGCDLDGWQWRAECPKMAAVWQQQTCFANWRAALVTAALAYINGY